MLFSIIGSPCSGKTTVASAVFAKLKEDGIPAEYISEQARVYIAKKRVRLGLDPVAQFEMTDHDQFNIMEDQLELEEVLSKACGPDVILIADSSSLNSLLYMSQDFRQDRFVQQMTARSVELINTVFVAPPVQRSGALDPNRVHDYQQSLEIHTSIPNVLQECCPLLKTLPLIGYPSNRMALVLQEIYRVIFK